MSSELDKPPPPDLRQTLSYLSNLLQQYGLRPKNKLGQNFLIDLNIVDLIVRSAELSRDDLAVEVGTGTGSLSARLAGHAGALFTVEISPAFHALAQENVGARPRVRFVCADILKNKNQLNPDVLRLLEEFRGQSGCSRAKLVANLPYAVATPVISNFLLLDWAFERMVVTVQWEIAERLMARPGKKDYGALAILVQSVADVSLIRRLAPSVFWPRPKVDSAIVLIRPDSERRSKAPEIHKLRVFLRDLYAHRRKNLRGSLISLGTGRHDKAEVDGKLAGLGLDGHARAETLGIEEHWRLCEAFG